MAKRAGKAYVRASGQLLESLPGASIDIGGTMREAVVGHSYYGHTEQEKPSEVNCEISIPAGMSLAELHRALDSTVTFELDTGQTYIVREAVLSEPPGITDGNPGKAALKWIGPAAEEVVGS